MAITETTSQTGRFGAAKVNGVAIGITGWSCTVRKEFADSTDSNNFDPTTNQTWTSQQPGVVGADAMVKGNFDQSGIADANFIQKFKTDGPYAMEIDISRTQQFAAGVWDFSDVQTVVEIPGSTMVTWTANCKSNGVVTLF